MIASGTFNVDLQPAAENDGTPFNRMSIDKTFNGDLEATSRGVMLSAMTGVQGSAGYVALEQVQGSLAGRRGSFVLQHYGVMKRGEQRLILEVVPDSGSGQLQNLAGRMAITIVDGDHRYEFDHELPE